ncbi:hypothetical protein D3C71_449020 [compost metagenome]
MKKYILELTADQFELLYISVPMEPTPWTDDEGVMHPPEFGQETYDEVWDKLDDLMDELHADTQANNK